ncbi:hypothetical protein Tco_1186470 [Tanacetum coccineum]
MTAFEGRHGALSQLQKADNYVDEPLNSMLHDIVIPYLKHTEICPFDYECIYRVPLSIEQCSVRENRAL